MPPMDIVMYWTAIYAGDYCNPPEAAPIWEFCDEEEAPEHFSMSDETGLMLVED